MRFAPSGKINIAVPVRIWRTHVPNLWSFLLLGTVVKKWLQPVVIILVYCELHSASLKVIADTLTWGVSSTFHGRRHSANCVSFRSG